MALKPGDAVPDIELTTHDGKKLSLRDLRGRKALVWFFPEADTPGWTIEGRGFRDQLDLFSQHGIAVLGASFNDVEQNAAFAGKFNFGFPLICDVDRSLGMAFGACKSPKDRYAQRISVLIDEAGKVVRVYDKVNPRDHAAQVLADVVDSGWSRERDRKKLRSGCGQIAGAIRGGAPQLLFESAQ
jgi:peroxiredoxin Q/BCP